MKKKTGLKFALTMVACALFGALCSIIVNFSEQSLTDIIDNISDILIKNSTVLMFIGVVPLIIGSVFLVKARSVIEQNNNLDEDEFEKTHKTLSLALYVPSVLMPWLFVCFGFSVTYNFGIESPYILMDLIIFILELAWVTILQYQIVEQTKKILPEKRGNVLDSKFQKEWYSSCDEAEKQIIGEACYISCKTMNMVYPILFAIMIFVCSLYDLSPFIFLMVGVLWLIQILSYLIPSYKLEHGKKSRR